MRISYRHFLPIALLALSATLSQAAELSSDGKAAIPKDVQQLIVVDYRAMQNSPAAMDLKERVLPPELKRLETALKNAKLNVDKECDVLAFASFRDGGQGTRIVGIAQGQFQTRAILALLAGGDLRSESLYNGVDYLIKTQRANGNWDEEYCTGTGFPSVFYLAYTDYRNTFPLFALAAFRKSVASLAGEES